VDVYVNWQVWPVVHFVETPEQSTEYIPSDFVIQEAWQAVTAGVDVVTTGWVDCSSEEHP